jgi:crotonobetainyl-CoA:carnitine CoA-transferase CaiB-like acyl-CoA transferase
LADTSVSVTSKELATTGSGADASPRHYVSLGANGRAAASADVTEPLSIAQGMGGIMHVTGEPDGPPTSVGLPICDLGTGIWAAQGILAALYERERTGIGCLVECSLLETAIGFSSWTSAQWLADHEEPTRQGSRHRQNAPYQRMRTEDGYLMIGAAGEAIWARCAKALGHPEWCEDPRFATNQQRMQNRAALEAVMNAVLATDTTEHWVGVLEAGGVPCGPVHNYAQMFADPQVRHAASFNTRRTPNWARSRTSAPRSRSARACGCAPSPPRSASTMTRSSAASASARWR